MRSERSWPATADGPPAPPSPFEPLIEALPAGSRMYRMFTAARDRHATTFNPGAGGPHRFSFFGNPVVPVLYAAQTEMAALCESLLHDVPLTGGRLLPEQYQQCVAGAFETTRELRLASFRGIGLRRLGVDAAHLTASPPRTYHHTVAWGQAAHDIGLDGVVWMSSRCNTDRAYVLFGDRVRRQDLHVAADYARLFTPGPGLDWLIDACASMKVDVLMGIP